MAVNGRLDVHTLTLVQDHDLFLLPGTANAFRRLQQAAKNELHRTISIARRAGAYRSLQVQAQIQHAWDSHDPKLMAEWNLDPGSRTRPASPGGSNHGWAVAVDIVGTTMDAQFTALARRYGFTFPFAGSDPRHALHDGKTATSPIPRPIDVKGVAAFLNRQHLVPHIHAEESGDPGPRYYLGVQLYLHKVGRYPMPPYRADGVPGTMTRKGERWISETKT